MRALLILLLTTTAAQACPLPGGCPTPRAVVVSASTQAQRGGLAKRAMNLRIRTVRPSGRLPALPPKAKPDVDENGVPRFWARVRSRVYAEMPQVKDADHNVKLMLAPVIVTGTFDTVPGLGVAGDF